MRHDEAIRAMLEDLYKDQDPNVREILLTTYVEQFNIELEIGLAHGYSVADQVRIITEFHNYLKIIQNSNGVVN